ncbi:hydrolase [Phaeobacter italicus]|uniref:amidohydrolase family protein n=1 Tax=Phaeobacter italicus TaxID=481446 RepID=UPI0027541E2F|nr:amidohydrolase family protein [Phaeobacter italicus]GLO75186.1 hydrolase [Phaeobacter italicus]
MKIDAHQHFWALERGDYGWLTPELKPIYRDFLPDDLQPSLRRAGIEGTVLVQAAPTVAETEYLLSLAAENSFIKGVVGWVDFDAPDAAQEIAKLAGNPALVGLRPMIQDIDDPNWMLDENLAPAYQALQHYDLAFDALVLPRHLGQLLELLKRYPNMRSVIDHGAKPEIRDSAFSDWAADMAALAYGTNAYCKLSGLVTEAARDWTTENLRPYVDHLLDTFGPQRLIWGSDWPVCTLASSYDRWVDTTETLLATQTDADRVAILGGNAANFYNLRN